MDRLEMKEFGYLSYLCGVKYAEILTVCMWSLRKMDPERRICVVVTDDQCQEALERISADKRLRVEWKRMELVKYHRHSKYVGKTQLFTETPFERTVFLDADTVILGQLDKLSVPPVALTQFSRWHTSGRIVKGRLRQWLKISDEITRLAEAQMNAKFPALNTGVFGFHKGAEGLDLWARITREGWRCSFTDELAAQLVWPCIPNVEIFNDHFNWSPKHSKSESPAVLHFHGRAMFRRPGCEEIYAPYAKEALAENAGGLAEWAGTYDPVFRRFVD